MAELVKADYQQRFDKFSPASQPRFLQEFKKMKNFIALLVVVFVTGTTLIVTLNWSFIKQLATYSPIILPHFGSSPANEAEARLQDVDYLGRLLQYDRSFDEAARIEFKQLLASSKQDVDSMSLADLYMLGAKATALADNGHTEMFAWPIRGQFNSVGVRYYYFQDGLYVVRALAEHEQLLGGRVVEIDGQPIEAIFTALNAYSGGTAVWRQSKSVILLESPQLLHAADLAASPDGYTLTVADQSGDTLQVELNAQLPLAPENIPFPKMNKNLDAAAWPVEGDEWVRTLQDISTDEVPLYLRQTDQLYMWTPLQNDGGYVRIQAMVNGQEQSMGAFFDDNLKPLPDGSLQYLVVDLRANAGGDFVWFVESAKWLPNKVADNGRLYILVGSQTFSAAINGAGLLKHYGGEKAIIIGSPMGDREQYWGEFGLDFRLPNSNFKVNYATGYHDWENGCEDHPYCFTQFLKHGVAAGSLAPNQLIEPTYAEYAAGRDVVLEWVYEQELP